MPGNEGRNGRGPQRRQPSRTDVEFERMLLARHGRLRRRHRKRRSILLIGALLVASIIALLLATVAFTGQQILTSQCTLKDLRPLSLGENSFLYSDNGQFLGVVPSATNRQPLPLSKMSPWLPEATVAIEDARFWQHGALDYQGIVRALYQDVPSGQIVQGGSTLTQELVRNLYIGNPQKTLSRKIKEACLADKCLREAHPEADPRRRTSTRSSTATTRTASRPRRRRTSRRAPRSSTSSRRRSSPACRRRRRCTTRSAIRARALARRNEVLQAMWKNGYITASKLRAATQEEARAQARSPLHASCTSRTSSAGRRSSSPTATASGRSSAAG